MRREIRRWCEIAENVKKTGGYSPGCAGEEKKSDRMAGESKEGKQFEWLSDLFWRK